MEVYLIINGVSTDILTLSELKKFKQYMDENHPKQRYEVIKCIKGEGVFFVTGKKVVLRRI